MTAIFDTPILFDSLKGFTPTIRPLADGVRASTAAECASCAIIEYLHPNDERVSDYFNAGVATLGHLLHQCWAYQAFEGVARYEVEGAIPWEHGVSHDDVVTLDGPHAGLYEVKTHSDKEPKAPSAVNRRQSEFRLRLRERANLPLPGPMMLVMIGKAGREGAWVRGPWTVELTDERRIEIDATIDAITRFLAHGNVSDLHSDDLKSLSGGCSKCFPKPRQEITSGALDGLLGRYVKVKREHDEIDTQRKTYADAKKALKTELDELRAAIESQVPAEVVLEGRAATVTRTKTGITIKAA